VHGPRRPGGEINAAESDYAGEDFANLSKLEEFRLVVQGFAPLVPPVYAGRENGENFHGFAIVGNELIRNLAAPMGINVKSRTGPSPVAGLCGSGSSSSFLSVFHSGRTLPLAMILIGAVSGVKG